MADYIQGCELVKSKYRTLNNAYQDCASVSHSDHSLEAGIAFGVLGLLAGFFVGHNYR